MDDPETMKNRENGETHKVIQTTCIKLYKCFLSQLSEVACYWVYQHAYILANYDADFLVADEAFRLRCTSSPLSISAVCWLELLDDVDAVCSVADEVSRSTFFRIALVSRSRFFRIAFAVCFFASRSARRLLRRVFRIASISQFF